MLHIHSYDDVILGELKPPRRRVNRRMGAARFKVPVMNNGNQPVQVRLSADSPDRQMLFEFRLPDASQVHAGQIVLTLQPGRTVLAQMTVLPGSIAWIGLGISTVPFQVKANILGKAQVPQVSEGDLLRLPVIGARQMALIGGTVLAGLFMLSILGLAGQYCAGDFDHFAPGRGTTIHACHR